MRIRLMPKYSFLLLLSTQCLGGPCVPPQSSTCAFYVPDIAHAWIKVNFKNGIPDQAVYLDGGCVFGVEKFTPDEPVKNIHPNKNMTLKFTLCANGQFVNVEEVELTSSSDTSIICDYKEKLVCKNHTKKKSFWDRI